MSAISIENYVKRKITAGISKSDISRQTCFQVVRPKIYCYAERDCSYTIRGAGIFIVISILMSLIMFGSIISLTMESMSFATFSYLTLGWLIVTFLGYMEIEPPTNPPESKEFLYEEHKMLASLQNECKVDIQYNGSNYLVYI